MDSLLQLNCSKSVITFSRPQLIEKVRPIVHYDDEIVKLISSFCNLPILDNMGRGFSLNTGIPHLTFMADILFNIILDDIFNKCNLISPTMGLAIRGGKPIPFSGGFFHINNDGKCDIKYDYS